MKKTRLKCIKHFLMITLLVVCSFSSVCSKRAYALEVGLTEEEKKSSGNTIEVSIGTTALAVEYIKNKTTCEFSGEPKKYFEKKDANLRGDNESWIYFQYTKFNGLSESEQLDVVESLTETEVYKSLSKTSQSELLLMIDNKINFTNSGEVNTLFGQNRADMVGGYKLFSPFGSKLGVVLALLALFSSATLVISVLVDMTYMYIPLISNKMKDSVCMKFVSKGAKRTVHELETSGSSIECFKVYVTERFISISVFVISLAYLLSSQIFYVFAKFLQLFNF